MIKVVAFVDEKEVSCVPGQTVAIKGDKIELYLPDYKSKSEASTWGYYNTHELNIYQTEFQTYYATFPLDSTEGKSDVYTNFRFDSKVGKLQKVCVWTDDGCSRHVNVKHWDPKSK